MGTAEVVERSVAPVLASLGFELVDVECRPGVVKLTIDRQSGLDLGAISTATVAVSNALDAADPVPGGRYELEVSSPGVERRLRRPEHYGRAVGSRIAVRMQSGAEADRRFEGLLKGSDAGGVEVELDGGAIRRAAYDDIERSHTVFDWRAALAADSLARSHEQHRESRPTAADRSRAAAAARQDRERGIIAGDPVPSSTLPAEDRHQTETA